MLKQTSTAIAPVLTRIYNFSLATSTYPDQWKIANVTPIHKKEEKHIVSNYRPISLLDIAGKVFERCVHNEIFNYLQTKNFLTKLQGAYMPASSTTCQLLEIYHHILQAMDEGKECRLIFCDFSKAFDKIWHKGLLHRQ